MAVPFRRDHVSGHGFMSLPWASRRVPLSC